MEILKEYIKDVNKCLDTNLEKINNELKPYNLTTEDLKLKEEGNDYEYIKNYYRFFIGGPGLNLYDKELGDFDCYPRVIEQIKKDYENIKFNGGRYFILDEMKYYFETDTAYSFKRVFHDFLRKNYNDYFIKYLKEYNLKEPNEVYKSAYLLKNIDKIEFKEEHKELMEIFNKFAKLYHTYNNVILVPYGYNVKRNRAYKDVYSVSMQKLIDDFKYNRDLIKKYCRYYENEDMYKFDESIMNKLNSKNEITTDEYKRYLNEAINFIENKKL